MSFAESLRRRLGVIEGMGSDATSRLRNNLAARQAAQPVADFSNAGGVTQNVNPDGSISVPVSMPTGGGSFDKFMRAISAQESGSNYGALGVPVRGDRAYGKYQIMGNNIPSWTRAATGQSYTPQQFIRNPQLQETTAKHHLRNYFNKYGPAGAAVAWYAGEGNAKKYMRGGGPAFNRKQTGGRFPSMNSYAQSILRRMGQG